MGGVFALFLDEELGFHGAQKAISVPICNERVIYETALAIAEEKLVGFPGRGEPYGRVGWLEPC
ncbi:MAG: hypothetical protein QXP01_01925 [Candidatus Hadarchaeum sp.]